MLRVHEVAEVLSLANTLHYSSQALGAPVQLSNNYAISESSYSSSRTRANYEIAYGTYI